MTTFFPPIMPKLNGNEYKIFLAGTIDNGKSIDWQQQLTDDLLVNVAEYHDEVPIVLFNPRRPDWNANIKQNINDPEFNKQVNWELDLLNQCNLIVMDILPQSLSPITLLELGLFANSGKLIVYCADEFWRKGNVDIVCFRNNIPQPKDWNDLVETVKTSYYNHVG